MRKLFLILILFCCLVNFINAQTPVIDSLRKELVISKNDSIKVHDRIRISWYLIQIPDSSSAWKYINEADSIANKTGNPVLKGIVYEHLGFLHNRLFSKKAVTYYLQAENILKNYPNSLAAKKSMASLCLNIGIEHMNVNDEEGALYYYFEGIKRYEAFDNMNRNLPILYANIIDAYFNLGKYESALSYCDKAYAKSMTSGMAPAQMSASINYGRVLMKLNRPGKAAFYLLKGKSIADSVNDLYFQSKYYQVIGGFKFEENKFDEALADFTTALTLIKKTNAPYDIVSCYTWMGACNTGLKNFQAGRKYLDTAFPIAKENNYLHLLKYIYLNRYHLEKAAGNFYLAINNLDSFNVINDSLQLASQADKIEFLDAKYQAEKKDAQISQLQTEKELQQLYLRQKNTLNYILIAAGLILFIFVFLLNRNLRQKQKLQQQRIIELETQQKLTATEAVLKGEEQERTRLAKDLHDGLGGMLSGIKYSLSNMKGNLIMTPDNAQAFERSMDMLDSSIKEMRRVAHNMMPEALVKFGLDTALKDFCNEINQTGALSVNYQSIGLENEMIEQTTAVTIYRIVQELINNTLKHAAAKKAIVQVTKSDRHLSVTVEDDGRGFDINILKQALGIGWSNIQNRVEFLKGTLDVQSEKDRGTSVHIEMNV